MQPIAVLHLDDEPVQLMGVENALSKSEGGAFSYRGVNTPAQFFEAFEALRPDCVLLDLELAGDSEGGIRVLRALRERGFDKPVVILSSVLDTHIIRMTIAAGATDLITKSTEDTELGFRLQMTMRNDTAIKGLKSQSTLLFAGETIRRIMQKLPRVVASNVKSVLVLGETGTGKEVVADCLRSVLPSMMPFVAINCATITESIMESELFGHEKGAFTGALTQKRGLFSVAHGGWIFLDEVARLSPSCQGALLRVLENGEIRPVGAPTTVKVNVRVLAATNEDLDDMCEKGLFRQDLLQRLRGYQITIPPLRERLDELEDIVTALVQRLNDGRTQRPYRLAPAVRKLLLGSAWEKGNIRELWQVLVASTVEAIDGLISVSSLPESFLASLRAQANETTLASTKAAADAGTPRTAAPAPTPLHGMVQLRVAGEPAFPTSLPLLEDELLLALLDSLAKAKPNFAWSLSALSREILVHPTLVRHKLARLAAHTPLAPHLQLLVEDESLEGGL